MKLNLKKFFASAISFCMIFSCLNCVNVFAKNTDIVYFDKDCKTSVVSSIPNGEAVVSVVPSKDSLAVGEEFYVDFILKNNPGFAAYGFTIEYDPSVIIPIKGNADELDAVSQVTYNGGKPVVSSDEINESIDIGKTSGKFFRSNILYNGEIMTASGNGILFRVNFKTVGTGTSYINLLDRSKVLLCDEDAENINAYVQNAEVVVGDKKDTSNNDTENNTVSDNNSNNNTDNSKDSDTNKVTQKETEKATEKVSENTTEAIEAVTESAADNNDGFIVNLPRKMSTPREFGDIASVPWAKQSIVDLSSLGIINGVTDVTFNPKAYTYRGDFVVVISRLLGLNGTAENVFSDVDNSAYYANAVSLANKFEIVKGSNGMFMPKNNITRQDAMVILSRVLEKAGKLQKADESVLNGFNDKAQISPYAVSAMADLVGMGIVNGDNNNSLNPKGLINRAEMAVVINRIYNVLK